MSTSMTETDKEIKGLPEDEGKTGSSSKKSIGHYNSKSKNKNKFKGRPDSKTGKPTNDPAYYSKYPELLEGSANLNYSDPLGKLIKWKNTNIGGFNVTGDTSASIVRSVPGVLGIKTRATFGFNDNSKSPLNVAANTIYVDLRYNLSGRKNYDAVDVLMYMGAISELYSAVNWAARIYGLAFDQSQTNMFITTGIAEAMNIDLDSIRHNLANYRYWLNSFIEKVSCYAIPKGITFFDKKVDEYTYVYIENNDQNIKDQLYLKYPAGFYQFKLDADGAGMLHYNSIPYGQNLSYETIVSICESLLTKVWNDEDFALISGDILKRYEGNIIGLTNLPAEGGVNITYDELFLLQLKNSNPVHYLDEKYYSLEAPTFSYVGAAGTTLQASAGDVVQDKSGLLLSKDVAMVSVHDSLMVNAGLTQDKIIDQIGPNPGLGDNIESSRMMVKLQSTAGAAYDGKQWYWVECGAYVITGLQIVYFQAEGNKRLGHPYKFNMPLGNVFNLGDWASQTNFEKFMITFFKYFPNTRLIGINAVQDNQYVAYMHFITNLDNFTWVDDATLEKMHDCAWLSMLAVPGVAKVKNSLF